MDSLEVAKLALAVSIGSLLVAACALVLQLRRWFDEGVKLSHSVMADARVTGRGFLQDDATYLMTTVSNRGTAASTITHLLLFNYPDRLSLGLSWLPRILFKRPRFVWRWYVKHGPQTFVLNPSPAPLPRLLEPGRNWQGIVLQTPEIDKMIGAGRLFVGVVGSHSEKRRFRRVRRLSLAASPPAA